jgi:hypothetical protein
MAAANISLIGEKALCEDPHLVSSYLDNIDKLGLIDLFPEGRHYVTPNIYDELENHPRSIALRDGQNLPGISKGEFERSGLHVTSFGSDFINACVRAYEQRNSPAEV